MRSNGVRHNCRYYYRRVASNSFGTEDIAEQYDIVDINSIPLHIELFKKHMPNAKPSYMVHAVKRNVDAQLIAVLHDCECLFNLKSIVDVRNVVNIIGDCTHMDKRRETRLCFTAATKSRYHINEAMSLGINRMTVSCLAELLRISSVSNTIELVLQVKSCDVGGDTTAEAEKRSWTHIIETANLRGMKIVGISIGTSNENGLFDTRKKYIPQTFSMIREAYDLATAYGHNVSFVDLGYFASEILCAHSPHERCSTILEELGDDLDHQYTFASKDQSKEYALLSTLFESHLPQSLGLTIFVQHAQYFVADPEKILKWWSMPKVRRPTSSLYSFLVGESCRNHANTKSRNTISISRQKM